ncbi:CPCC family cysteine-rich protein [Streptomyces sp. NPDC059900]|uniref:CPCC family cysteine-rich protein n=1 Tax=Streptomyces sp. NPDC059900 TaxID=3155816 RepID=UPI00342B5494
MGSRSFDAAGKRACFCCGFLTLESRGRFEICPVCGWEDAWQDDHNADEYLGGPNQVTLSEARENFAAFGASEERRRKVCGNPSPANPRIPDTITRRV